MPSQPTSKPTELKLSIREEGEFIHATFMGREIARIVATACHKDPTVFEDFNALCAKVMKNAIEAAIGPDMITGYRYEELNSGGE